MSGQSLFSRKLFILEKHWYIWHKMYRHLIKKMQSTCKTWVLSLNSHEYCRGQIYRSCQKHESLSLHGILSIGCHFLGVRFITSLNSNLCTALTTQNTTKKILCYLTSKNRALLQPIVFLNGIHPYWLRKWESRLSPAQKITKVKCKFFSQ